MVKRPSVVIVGSGFGGMQAAQSLAGSDADVLLIDRHNYNTFVPLLYQVATAQLDPGQVAFPIRTLLRRFSSRRRHVPVRFLQADVLRIDLGHRVVETANAAIAYDYLVIATGSRTRSLGVPGVDDYGFALHTLDDAIALRNQILNCFEQAMHQPDLRLRLELLTIVIVGGGATGVEMAGALMEMVRGPLRRDFPELDWRQVRVLMVQSGDRLLPDLPANLGHYTCRRLRRLGVEVYLNTRVEQVLPTAVCLSDGQTLPASTVIWTAGVEAEKPDSSEPIPTMMNGKLVVRPTLQLLEHPRIYALGDAAYIEQNGQPLTGVAPEALQAGVAIARNIKRQIRGQNPSIFRYFNKGRLAIIGCYAGVGQIGPVALTGVLAWCMWLAVHVVYLPGFRNRLFVVLSWVQTYLLGDRPARYSVSVSESRSAPHLSAQRLKHPSAPHLTPPHEADGARLP